MPAPVARKQSPTAQPQPDVVGVVPKASDLTRLGTFERALLLAEAREAFVAKSTDHTFEVRGYAVRLVYETGWAAPAASFNEPGIWRRFVQAPGMAEPSCRGLVLGGDLVEAVEDALDLLDRDLGARRRGWGSMEEERGAGFRVNQGLYVDETGASHGAPTGSGTILRRVPEAKSLHEKLRRLLHVRGVQWQGHTGEEWDSRRHALIEELLGEDRSSKDLTEDALSVLCDHLREDLEAAGFDVERADREYAERQAQREELFGSLSEAVTDRLDELAEEEEEAEERDESVEVTRSPNTQPVTFGTTVGGEWLELARDGNQLRLTVIDQEYYLDGTCEKALRELKRLIEGFEHSCSFIDTAAQGGSK